MPIFEMLTNFNQDLGPADANLFDDQPATASNRGTEGKGTSGCKSLHMWTFEPGLMYPVSR